VLLKPAHANKLVKPFLIWGSTAGSMALLRFVATSSLLMPCTPTSVVLAPQVISAWKMTILTSPLEMVKTTTTGIPLWAPTNRKILWAAPVVRLTVISAWEVTISTLRTMKTTTGIPRWAQTNRKFPWAAPVVRLTAFLTPTTLLGASTFWMSPWMKFQFVATWSVMKMN